MNTSFLPHGAIQIKACLAGQAGTSCFLKSLKLTAMVTKTTFSCRGFKMTFRECPFHLCQQWLEVNIHPSLSKVNRYDQRSYPVELIP